MTCKTQATQQKSEVIDECTDYHIISYSVYRGPAKYIGLGILKRSDPPKTWQLYDVSRILPHPDYKSPSKYHDIALLETETQ